MIQFSYNFNKLRIPYSERSVVRKPGLWEGLLESLRSVVRKPGLWEGLLESLRSVVGSLGT